MPYRTRLVREAQADTAGDLADTEFHDRLLAALTQDRAVKNAIRALMPAAAKTPAARNTRRT